jgi:hypothetical protein
MSAFLPIFLKHSKRNKIRLSKIYFLLAKTGSDEKQSRKLTNFDSHLTHIIDIFECKLNETSMSICVLNIVYLNVMQIFLPSQGAIKRVREKI